MTNNFNFDNFNAEEARIGTFDVYENEGGENEVSHDDGFMHVRVNGTRYTYDIGQDVSTSRYNSRANRIISSIGITGEVTGNNN